MEVSFIRVVVECSSKFIETSRVITECIIATSNQLCFVGLKFLGFLRNLNKMRKYNLVVLPLLVCVVMATDYHPQCGQRMYYNQILSKCVKCSKCSKTNEVIRVPCDEHNDTVCGPFIEFDKFHQAPIINLLPSVNHSQEVFVTSELNIVHKTDPGDANHTPITIKNSKWYTLAMVLLGVLSFVSLVIIIYIIIVCFLCKKKREGKEVLYDPEMAMPMQTYLPAESSGRVESDDSSGAVGGRMVVLPNVYVPYQQVGRADFDTDNSGQTVSSSSTNYVYFKAPRNANV